MRRAQILWRTAVPLCLVILLLWALLSVTWQNWWKQDRSAEAFSNGKATAMGLYRGYWGQSLVYDNGTYIFIDPYRKEVWFAKLSDIRRFPGYLFVTTLPPLAEQITKGNAKTGWSADLTVSPGRLSFKEGPDCRIDIHANSLR